MADYRVVLCEACGSEGRLFFFDTEEPCPYCEGTGGEIIEVYPIEMEDLDIIAGIARLNKSEAHLCVP